jgi:hypothetical protein
MKRVSVDASVTDLFFRKSLLLHKSVLNGPDSNPFWRKFSVAGQRNTSGGDSEHPPTRSSIFAALLRNSGHMLLKLTPR